MLANGTKLAVKKKTDTEYVALPGLKEIPEMGVEAEKVDNTTLEDEVKQYENGIGDSGDMTYIFKYDNAGENTSYRILRKIEVSKEVVSFKETLPDGTTTTFDAQVAIKRTGGGVNGAIDFNAALSLQSKLTIQDPTSEEPKTMNEEVEGQALDTVNTRSKK